MKNRFKTGHLVTQPTNVMIFSKIAPDIPKVLSKRDLYLMKRMVRYWEHVRNKINETK